MLAVVDTNVWISALVSREGGPARIAELIGEHFTPVFCKTTLNELRGVAARDKFRNIGLTAARYERLDSRLRSAGLVLDEPEVLPVTRDPKDDVFIALAIASHAGYLVSGAGHFIRDETVRAHLTAAGVALVTVRELVEFLERPEEQVQ